MAKEGYLERWILPLNDLNSGTVYEGRPVGNSPELMCLDSHLFNDVDQAMSMHVAITRDLPESDPQKIHACNAYPSSHVLLPFTCAKARWFFNRIGDEVC